MSKITVSVVMPVYNGEGYLRECLDSVCAQTLRDIEIICVDDGSSDGSLAILDEYAAADPRIKVIAQPNSGAAVARNKGIAIAQGEYLSILDSDDWFEPKMLETMVARARAKNAQIVICRCVGFEDGTEKHVDMSWSLKDEFIPSECFAGLDVGDGLFYFTQGWAWDKLYLTSFVREHDLQFQNLKSTNDMLFTFLSIALAQRITTVGDVFIHQRRNRSTSISRTRQLNCDCFYHALTALKSELIHHGIFERTRKAFENLSAHLSMWHFNSLSSDHHCFFYLYEKFQTEYFPALGIGTQPEEYFLEKVRFNYRHCVEILNTPVQDYLFRRVNRAAPGKPSNAAAAELAEIKKSTSYKVGQAITWLPRAAKKLIRSLRVNGISGTFRRIFGSR